VIHHRATVPAILLPVWIVPRSVTLIGTAPDAARYCFEAFSVR
jgi:hypothetical protein